MALETCPAASGQAFERAWLRLPSVRNRVLTLAAGLGTLAILAACGRSGPAHVPSQGALPLVDGAKVVAQVRECDPGSNSYCATMMVVVNNRYRTSKDLLLSERSVLRKHGWTGTGGGRPPG